ncbi:MAG: hypothetical protein AAFN70_08645, partial [Planctomycetota bacterium]
MRVRTTIGWEISEGTDLFPLSRIKAWKHPNAKPSSTPAIAMIPRGGPTFFSWREASETTDTS